MSNALSKLRKENNKVDKELRDYDNVVLTDIIVYLHSSSLHEYDIEVMRKELIGMALEAQIRGEKLSDIIGEDYKSFCDELMKSGSTRTRYDMILESMYIIISGIIILFVIELIFSPSIIKMVTKGNFDMPISLGFLVSTAAIVGGAYGILWYITKNSFELTGKTSLKLKVSFVIVYAAIFAAVVFCKVKLNNNVIFTVNGLYTLSFLIVGFLVVNILTNKSINNYAKSRDVQ